MTSVLITCGHELAALSAARSLGRAGHHVTVAVPDGFAAPVRTSRYVAQVIASPDPWQDQAAFRHFLLDTASRHDVLLPISEAAMFATAACREQLTRTLLLLPSDKDLVFALSKYHATRAAQAAGLKTPATAFLTDGTAPTSLSAMCDAACELGFPLLLKHDNCKSPDGTYQKGRTISVRSRLQTRAVLSELQKKNTPILAQQIVAGHGVGTFLLRWDGETRLDFAHTRLHEVPYSGGVSSLRKSCHDAHRLALSERLLSHIGYQGVAMCEFRENLDGEPVFLEINGRLWGSLALSLHCGVDFPLALLRLSQGAPFLSPLDYPDDVLCRNVFPGEFFHLSSLLRAAEVPLSQKIRAGFEQVVLSLDPTVRHDHLWLDDPGPGLVQARRLFQDITTRIRRFPGWTSQALRDRRLLAHEQAETPSRFDKLPHRPRRILVLCLGNICRSPFAERHLRQLLDKRGITDITIESAGFLQQNGRPTPEQFVEIARGFRVDLSTHKSKLVQPNQFDDADLILLMDLQNLRRLFVESPQNRHKAFLIGLLARCTQPEIPDPYLLSPAQVEASYQLLSTTCQNLVNDWATDLPQST